MWEKKKRRLSFGDLRLFNIWVKYYFIFTHNLAKYTLYSFSNCRFLFCPLLGWCGSSRRQIIEFWQSFLFLFSNGTWKNNVNVGFGMIKLTWLRCYFEGGTNQHWDDLARYLAGYNKKNKVWLTIVPQCPFPDALVGGSLKIVFSTMSRSNSSVTHLASPLPVVLAILKMHGSSGLEISCYQDFNLDNFAL